MVLFDYNQEKYGIITLGMCSSMVVSEDPDAEEWGTAQGSDLRGELYVCFHPITSHRTNSRTNVK